MIGTRLLCLVAFALATAVGCSVNFGPKIPAETEPPGGIVLGSEDTARNMPAVIGAGRFTLFALKVADVRIKNGNGAELVMDSIRNTFESNGYLVSNIREETIDAPTLLCTVQKFSFTNYTWVFPLVWTWGGIDLDLEVIDQNGKRRWKESYSGGSWNMWMSFSSAVNSAMGKILVQVSDDIASEGFRSAMSGSSDRAPTAARQPLERATAGPV